MLSIRGLLALALLALGLAGRVPVVYHLESQNCIECKTSDESVQDKFVVYFLEGSENSGKGTSEVIENLEILD